MANTEPRKFFPRRRIERVLIALATALTGFLVAPETIALIRALNALLTS